MKAVGQYIVIDQVVEEEKSSSGLFLSVGQAEEMRYGRGTVVSSGDAVSAVKDGDYIYFDKRNGHQVMIQGKRYGVIKESDVVVLLDHSSAQQQS